MKKSLIILTLTALIGISLSANARMQKGIYLTAEDFRNKKLSYEKDSKIRLNNSVWTMPYITVVDNGKKLNLEKKEVFGYEDHDNKTYRFYRNDVYQIIETAGIIIYVQAERIPQSKGTWVKKNFYFSTTVSSEIFPLTLCNLKNAYRNNEKFIDMLDQFFRDGNVTAYDATHNTYKVSYVFSKTLSL